MMRVLAWTDYYEPGFRAGGPISSLKHLAGVLPADTEMRMVTRRHDYGVKASYAGVPEGQWVDRGRCHLWYLNSRSIMAWLRMLLAVREYKPDLYYFNSYFSPIFSRLPLVLMRLRILPHAPVLLAPRGEMLTGALGIKSWKKRPTLRLSQWIGLDKGVIWQATTEIEKQAIQAAHGTNPTLIVSSPDRLIEATLSDAPPREKRSPVQLVFVGRIAPIKNLHLLIRTVVALQGEVELEIYGPVDDVRYWRCCRRDIGSGSHVRYMREAASADLPRIIADHDFLVLISDSENFGHVALEALTVATPVIVTDTTPWAEFVRGRAGYVVRPGDAMGLRTALEAAASLSQSEYTELRVGCGTALSKFSASMLTSVPPDELFTTAMGLVEGAERSASE